MDFTIVTPSFRQLEPLSRCIASVADQIGVEIEHIVQDGGTDGFAGFSKKMAQRWPDRPGYRRVMVSEPDQGMYDAVNLGLKKGTGTFCAYLNCDEQYLPGILQQVFRRFQNSPETDLFLGDVVVVDPDGGPVCHRRVVRPTLAHTWTCHFSALTAGIFFQRALLDRGMFFDARYRAVADAEWFVRALRSGTRIGLLGMTTSAFAELGTNLGLGANARQERRRLNTSAPRWMRALRPWWVLMHRWRRLAYGAYWRRSLDYEIYGAEAVSREKFHAKKLPTIWPSRVLNY